MPVGSLQNDHTLLEPVWSKCKAQHTHTFLKNERRGKSNGAFFIFLSGHGVQLLVKLKKKASWAVCFTFLTFLFGGAFHFLILAIFDFLPSLSLSFCLHLTLYRTLDCLDFLHQGFVPTVIPMWNLYSPHDLTQWKCDVYMYRFLRLFLVFVIVCFMFLPPPPYSLFSPHLCFELIWLLPYTLKGNGTLSKYSYHYFTHKPNTWGARWHFEFHSVTFFTCWDF